MGGATEKEMELVADFRRLCEDAEAFAGSAKRDDRIKGHKAWRRARLLAPEVAKIASRRIAALRSEIAIMREDLSAASKAWESREASNKK